MVNHLTARAIKQSGRHIPFIVVITDPVTLHRAWVTHDVDQYIVATPEARENALKYGLPDDKIKVIGMPIDPKFFLRDKEKQVAREHEHLKPRAFTILLMGGGEGAGKMLEIIEEIDRQKLAVQLIVITGRNKSLETKLKKVSDKFSFPMRVFGFTDQVHELMAESDLIVTKAGPGTIAEAMAMGLPIIITSWLPGQEEGNVEFVVRENVGRVSQDPDKVVEIIKEMQQPDEFAKYQENIKRVSRPQAAIEIAQEIFSHLR
jgi:1,2-diacylglycerol 3-beta-galactosyltransferase